MMSYILEGVLNDIYPKLFTKAGVCRPLVFLKAMCSLVDVTTDELNFSIKQNEMRGSGGIEQRGGVEGETCSQLQCVFNCKLN